MLLNYIEQSTDEDVWIFSNFCEYFCQIHKLGQFWNMKENFHQRSNWLHSFVITIGQQSESHRSWIIYKHYQIVLFIFMRTFFFKQFSTYLDCVLEYTMSQKYDYAVNLSSVDIVSSISLVKKV